MTINDVSMERRLAYLERRVQELELTLARTQLEPKRVQPLNGRLWQFTLNEDFGDTSADYADADLLDLDGTDTLIDVDVYDGRTQFATYIGTGDGGWCVEQMALDGTRYYVVIQGDCP